MIFRILQGLNSVSSVFSLNGQVIQIRFHSKIYPWRHNRNNPECHLDNTLTPYTDRNNMNEFKSSKKKLKPWMKVVPKDNDNRFYKYKLNKDYTSDPIEARETAASRLARFQDSLRDRGAARQSKPYQPPADVEKRILSLSKDCYSSSSDEDILNLNLNQNREVKYSLLSRCIEEFEHDISNSWLNEIECIRDVVDYYLTPVRGVDPYTALVNKSDELPVNLTIIPEPERYDRTNDDRFGGYTALPGVISRVPGLRAAKKYPILNQDEFQWPDV